MKFRIANLLATLLLLLSAISAQADKLTLKDCLEQAKSYNPYLKTAKWDTKLAEENIRSASSANYPKVDIRAGYTAQQVAQAVVLGAVTAESQDADYFQAGVSINYTIYDFGRRKSLQEKSKAIASSTTEKFEAAAVDVSLQVIETYFAILEADKLVAAAMDEVKQVEEHHRVAKTMYEEGVVTRNDVLQAEVRLSNARQKLLLKKNLLENSWLQLNQITGRAASFRSELDEQVEVEGVSHLIADEANKVAKRHDIISLRKMVAATDFEVSESKSAFYPEIFAQGDLNYLQNSKLREQTIMSATIGIKFNLFNGFFSSSDKAKAVYNLSKKEQALRQAESEAELEINLSRNNLNVAKERMAVTEMAIRQSVENLRINQERYKERVGTATEVLDAQTLLTEAKTVYYSTLFEYQVSSARLKKALGEL